MASSIIERQDAASDNVLGKDGPLQHDETKHQPGVKVERDDEFISDAPLHIKEILAQMEGLSPMDEAVIEALPNGVSFSSVTTFAKSNWTNTGKVISLRADGTEQCFFLKVAFGEHGRSLLGGEFESSKMIHRVTPKACPFGYGQYKAPGPSTYFYISQFIDLDVTTAPKPKELMSGLAQLHKKSVSPTGKFGFPRTTYDVFFRNLFLGACALDAASNDTWLELDRAVVQIADAVIPRLLGSLRQSDSQEPIKPCLIHGDLWEGNRGISKVTGDNIVFDASSYFAHNEMEFGNWRSELNTFFRSKNTLSNAYIDEYLKHFPKTEPVDEFDDRNRLYSIKVAMNYSAMVPGSTRRKTAYNNMCYLIAKYAPIEGIDQYDPDLDPFVTGKHFEAYSATE
ncbi:Fructosamine kinase-domain-containing protein [Xylariaceae sp. FL1019]|nr:Fructosamine kinase-domain-containing protein [Xylariaceae sp. FL1019]